MFARLENFDRMFPAMQQLRRQMDEVWSAYDGDSPFNAGDHGAWPRSALWDEGGALMFRAEVPGLSEKDVTVSLNQDVLTVSGERRAQVPEGYQVHRKDRGTLRFSRSFALPLKVDADKVSAVVKHGVLTVHLPKAPESKPRQIAVRAD